MLASGVGDQLYNQETLLINFKSEHAFVLNQAIPLFPVLAAAPGIGTAFPAVVPVLVTRPELEALKKHR